MNALDPLARLLLVNAITAAALAVVAAVIGRRLRWPAAVHLLWLAVLLRMVTPPLLEVPLLAATAAPAAGLVAVTGAVLGTPPSTATSLVNPRLALTVAWSVGALLVLAVAAIRTRQLRRLLGRRLPAPSSVTERVRLIASRLGLHPPRTVLVEGHLPPMLWSTATRPTLVLPSRLVLGLDERRLDSLLAHELAHLARRDHWVRWLELVVTVVCWWNPVTWWARAQLRRAEERSADELVSRLLPDNSRAYADALVATLRFLAGIRVPATVGAIGMADLSEIQRRLEMILSHRSPRRRSLAARLLLLAAMAASLAVSPALTAGPDADQPARQFTGAPITLRLDHASLTDVLATFAQVTNHEILIEPGITGEVSIEAIDEPWDAVLDRLLAEQGLEYVVADGAIKIYRSKPKVASPMVAGTLDGREVYRYDDELITAPVRIAGSTPAYPEEARQEKVSGIVVLDVVIDAQGRLSDPVVVRAVDNRLTAAALDAVKDWVFEPATMNGEPVPVRYQLTVAFKLQ